MINFNQTIITLLVCLLLIEAQPVNAAPFLKLSTTTSTENSGILTILHTAFEKKYSARVNAIAVGTGKALRIGANGDVDVVLVHAPTAELKYIEQGDFIDRTAVMHNDFVILGPADDPAGVASAKNVLEAMRKIASAQSLFTSRGDDSGTHKKENQLWKKAEIEPKGNWYLEVGQGMGATLIIADNKRAYVLTDRGTQIAFSDKITLKTLFEGDSALNNPYHVMAVNPENHQYVQYELAKKYIEFLVSEEAQKIIADFKKSGQQLFYPDAIK